MTARQVIAAFGGIRPMARSLGLPHTTVQGWLRYDGRIPAHRIKMVVREARARKITLPKDFLDARAA